MDKVIASLLVLIAAFILQYLWQYYTTMTDEDGVVIAVDVAEPVTQKDEPQVLSLQVFYVYFSHIRLQMIIVDVNTLLLILLFVVCSSVIIMNENENQNWLNGHPSRWTWVSQFPLTLPVYTHPR